MRIIKKIGVLFLSICVLSGWFLTEAYAASASINVSSTSGTVGSTVTVTCTTSVSGASIGAADVVLEYEPSALEVVSCSSGANGSNGSVIYSGYATAGGQSSLKFTVKFKIKKEGSFPVSISSGSEVCDWDFNPLTPSRSNGKVTGKAATTSNNNNSNTTNKKDSNNKLKDLNIYPGTLSPVFEPNTTSYSVVVEPSVSEVTISATAHSAKATVAVSGGKELRLGLNEAKVIVTAENGSTTVYNIHITCGEPEKITIDNTTYFVNEDFTDEQIPVGFVREKVTYKERQYNAVKLEKGDMTLLHLKDADGNVAFFIYDTEKGIFTPFMQIQISETKYIMPISLEGVKRPENMRESTLVLEMGTCDAWQEETEGLYVIHTIDTEGKTGLYRYDMIDGTYQRYIEQAEMATDGVFAEIKPWRFLVPYYEYIILGLASLVLILITVVILLAARKKAPKEDSEQKQGIPSVREVKKDAKEKHLEKQKEKKPRKEKKKKQEIETPALDPVKGVPELQKQKKVKEPKVKLTKEEKRAAKVEAKKEKKYTQRMKRQKRRQAKHKEEF